MTARDRKRVCTVWSNLSNSQLIMQPTGSCQKSERPPDFLNLYQGWQRWATRRKCPTVPTSQIRSGCSRTTGPLAPLEVILDLYQLLVKSILYYVTLYWCLESMRPEEVWYLFCLTYHCGIQVKGGRGIPQPKICP